MDVRGADGARAEGARAGGARAGQAGGAKVVSAAERRAALGAVSGYLRCPVCAGPVRVDGDGRQLGCERDHRFDIARQGYVNLVSGRPGAGTADSAEMVAAREEFLGQGHYRPLAEAIAEMATGGAGGTGAGAREREPAGLVVDLAGGTGYYLAAVLDSLPGRYGACVDLSVPALRRAARAHPRAAAIGADAWRPLPLADGSAGIALSVFGPRNAGEISRVLAAGGTLIIASPGPGHLDELREPLGMIGIDERKSERIADAYGDYTRVGAVCVNRRLSLDHDAIAALVAMGPSARHITPEALTSRVRALPAPVAVTVDVRVRALQRPLLPRARPLTRLFTHAAVTHAADAVAPRSASVPGCAAGTGSFGSRPSTPLPTR